MAIPLFCSHVKGSQSFCCCCQMFLLWAAGLVVVSWEGCFFFLWDQWCVDDWCWFIQGLFFGELLVPQLFWLVFLWLERLGFEHSTIFFIMFPRCMFHWSFWLHGWKNIVVGVGWLSDWKLQQKKRFLTNFSWCILNESRELCRESLLKAGIGSIDSVTPPRKPYWFTRKVSDALSIWIELAS